MGRISTSDVVLKALGLLFLMAAVLKGRELLTVPVANKDLFSWRPFLIFQVEFELAMGIWLLSGVFKRLAWLAALACFCLFCCVTLYKALTGAASCGCFGRVRVNCGVTCPRLPGLGLLAFIRWFLKSLPLLSWSADTAVIGLIIQATTDSSKPRLQHSRNSIVADRFSVRTSDVRKASRKTEASAGAGTESFIIRQSGKPGLPDLSIEGGDSQQRMHHL